MTTTLEKVERLRTQLDDWFKIYSKDQRPVIQTILSSPVGTKREFDLSILVNSIELWENDEHALGDLNFEHCINTYRTKVYNMALPFLDEKGQWIGGNEDWQENEKELG